MNVRWAATADEDSVWKIRWVGKRQKRSADGRRLGGVYGSGARLGMGQGRLAANECGPVPAVRSGAASTR
jgi:hypothetical protein